MAGISTPEDPQKAGMLARAADTDPAILAALTTSSLAFVRDAALSNPSTPRSVVEDAVPSALRTESQVGAALAIASRSDASAPVLERLLSILEPSCVDGSRRENWPYEKLATRLLTHPNTPLQTRQAFLATNSVSKRVWSQVLSAVAGSSSEHL